MLFDSFWCILIVQVGILKDLNGSKSILVKSVNLAQNDNALIKGGNIGRAAIMVANCY